VIRQRPLGSTGARVSALGFGCMGLVGWYGERDDAEAHATVLAAVDAGATHLDTAAIYQDGENERFVGAAIRPRRNEVFLATKCGIGRNADGSTRADNRPETIQSSCEASLSRLGTDWIDLFYLHRIDKTVPIEESVGTLAELVRAGKVRYIGLSECSVATLERACRVHPIAAVQSEYSLWTREIGQGVLPACRRLGVGLVAYSPLGRGFLAGAFANLRELPAGDNRQRHPRFQPGNIEHNQRLVACLQERAAARGCTVAQLALAWVLAQGEDVLPIPGTKRRTRLQENLGALEVALEPHEADELAAAFAALGAQGERYPPALMQAIDR
jgi:aryl-alcohol dehydrogenase-like predicted oxidoreductase